MKTKNFLAGVVLALIGGLGMVNTVSAYAEVVAGMDGEIPTLTVCGTEYISNSEGASGCITIMDRNLGATSNDIESTGSYGTYYRFQGLRNDGLAYPVINGSERQGGCPDGYHIPSKSEWYALMDMWSESYANGYLNVSNTIFQNDFKIPFAGYRTYYDAVWNEFYTAGSLWSSSSSYDTRDGFSFQYFFLLNESTARISSRDVTDYEIMMPIRCFKNYIFHYVTFWDGTGEDKQEISKIMIESGNLVTQIEYFGKSNSYLVFDRWYTDTGLTQEFVFNTPIVGDLELYPKYEASEMWIDGSRNPFSWGEDITICDPEDSNACITMMDRNLGATTAGTGCEESNLNCIEAGWKQLRYNDYDDCLSNYYNDCRNGCQGEVCCEILEEEVPSYCGGGDYEGFDSYEECKEEETRLENEYNECMENNKGVYGYHYQWGNNYGFNLANGDIDNIYMSRDWVKWDSRYDNYGYNGSLLFQGGYHRCGPEGEDECFDGDYRENDKHYDGLRGGSGDSSDNNRGYDKENHVATNVEYRQGPCPEGYHVPSIGEWNTALSYYIVKNGDKELIEKNNDGLIGGYCDNGFSYHCYKEDYYEECYDRDEDGNCIDSFSESDEYEVDCEIDTYDRKDLECDGYGDMFNRFNSYFKIPYAGDLYFEYGDYFEGLNTHNGLWSSTPISNGANIYHSSIWGGGIGSIERINGNSVRCFKNTPDIENQGEGGNNGGGNTGNNGNSGGGSVGGGGSSLKKDNCPNGDYSDSYYDGTCGTKPQDSSSQTPQNDEQISQNDESNSELQTAYEWAYENGITTMDSIQKANMEGNLTRIAMAKMLSQYAINILGMEPDESRTAEFSDVDENLDSEYGDGVSLAYKLGIMGINMPDERFRPFDLVTRAEFVTALSRMKYGTPDGKEKYYSTHMELLNKLGIIAVTDPDMKELRGYVMLMLMRSAK